MKVWNDKTQGLLAKVLAVLVLPAQVHHPSVAVSAVNSATRHLKRNEKSGGFVKGFFCDTAQNNLGSLAMKATYRFPRVFLRLANRDGRRLQVGIVRGIGRIR